MSTRQVKGHDFLPRWLLYLVCCSAACVGQPVLANQANLPSVRTADTISVDSGQSSDQTSGRANASMLSALAQGEANLRSGQLAEAERVLRSLITSTDTLGLSGEARQDVARAWAVLSRVARAYRCFNRAIEYAKQGMRVIGEVENPSASDVAFLTASLAFAERGGGQYSVAESLYVRALTIVDSVYGEMDLEAATYHNDLAALYINLRRLDEAVAQADTALAILHHKPEEGTPQIEMARACFAKAIAGIFQDSLADLSGDFDGCIRIYRENLGDDCLPLESVYGYYSYYCRLRGKYRKAIELSLKAADIAQQNYIENGYPLTDLDALNLASSIHYAISDAACAYYDMPVRDSITTTAMVDAFLRQSGCVMYDLLLRRKFLAASHDTTLATAIKELEDVSTERSRLNIRDGASLGLATMYHPYSLLWREQECSAIIGRTIRSQRKKALSNTLTVDSLIAIIPDSTSYVVYFSYLYVGPSDEYSEATHCFAVVLDKQGMHGPYEIAFRDAINRIEAELFQLMQDRERLSSFNRRAYDQRVDSITGALYEMVWAPIADAVVYPTVFVTPDVLLATTPFGVLRQPDGRYLIEEHAFQILQDPHALSHERDRESGHPMRLLAIGDPNFGASPEERMAAAGDSIQLTFRWPTHASRTLHPDCPELDDLSLQGLPGTRREIQGITDAWNLVPTHTSTSAIGTRASEELVKSIAGRFDVVHFATHAYFLPKQCDKWTSDGGGWTEVSSPLLSSGLLLAGSSKAGSPHRGTASEDGILTAEEVSLLPMEHTQLVVLSACETARGTAYPGQGGALGLARAFQIAGARTVISSSWPIADNTTCDIMRYLYSNDSLSYAALLRLYAIEQIGKDRARGRHPDPFRWAPFMVSGDWRR